APREAKATGGARSRTPARRRDARASIYAGFDFLFAAIYAGLLLQVPTRHAVHGALLWGTVGAVPLAGAGMLWPHRWGWRVAAAGCGAVLLVGAALLGLLLLSASFLSGVYGGMGKGAALIALLVGALVIELVGFLPALQLKFLMTRAGRRAFGLGPLWR